MFVENIKVMNFRYLNLIDLDKKKKTLQAYRNRHPNLNPRLTENALKLIALPIFVISLLQGCSIYFKLYIIIK